MTSKQNELLQDHKDPLSAVRIAMQTVQHQDPFKDVRKAMQMVQQQDPLSEVRKAMQMVQQQDPLSEVRKAMQMVQQQDPLSEVRKAMQSMQQQDVFKDVRKAVQSMQAQDPFKDVRKAVQSMQHKEPLKNLSIIETLLKNSIFSCNTQQIKQFYDEVTEIADEQEVYEIDVKKNDSNTISNIELKARCYRVTISLIIILMVSTLEITEIEKVISFVFGILEKVGLIIPLVQKPTKKVENHYHITVENDSDIKKVIKTVQEYEKEEK
ncbi:hypothetical protein [Bacillus solitudinis]|uniref:hypothetical protein n=1 Tax=Bacillus solitudinis TaxID=2014074 RepID=UPI000C24DF76|nr:hypothetical protein [Bacillus solitudinis]